MKVWTKSAPSVGSDVMNLAAAALGEGNSTGDTPKPRTATSQR